jgi:DivIVA domain-containing protein
MNGDEVRDAWFLRRPKGYDASEVDDLLDRVAAELDAGRPVGPLIETATFQKKNEGYDIDAVDWFLDQLILHPGHAERAGTSADAWRDLPVTQFARGRVSGLAGPPRQFQPYFAEECRKAWRDFGQQPGMSLTWGWSGRLLPGLAPFRCELRTAETQTVASGDWYANAIMTAVDQAGNKIARYRRVAGRTGIDQKVEITIHPNQKLTDELVLAIAKSAHWLGKYFDTGA